MKTKILDKDGNVFILNALKNCLYNEYILTHFPSLVMDSHFDAKPIRNRMSLFWICYIIFKYNPFYYLLYFKKIHIY